MAAKFTSGVGPCVGIVEPFKHLFCVTAHPQILALELQALMLREVKAWVHLSRVRTEIVYERCVWFCGFCNNHMT